MDTVPFTEADVKAYLDTVIRHWRKVREEDGEKAHMAPYYVDAYQSVRNSIFGELLPAEDGGPVREPFGQAVNVVSCARCGQDHEMSFKPFRDSVMRCDGGEYTHWGMRPNTGDPVIMRIVEDDEGSA